MNKKSVYLTTLKPSGFEKYDEIILSTGVKSIIKYKLQLYVKKPHNRKGYVEKKTAYIIEIHCYDGFSMIKFYPKHKQQSKDKYKMRCHELNYRLTTGQIRTLLLECAILMKEYLDINPNNFVGFVGQPDKYDDQREKENSSRSNVYNPFTKSLFKQPQYEVISKTSILGPLNMTMIRKVLDIAQFKEFSQQQIFSYEQFISQLEANESDLLGFMTREAKIKMFGEEILEESLEVS